MYNILPQYYSISLLDLHAYLTDNYSVQNHIENYLLTMIKLIFQIILFTEHTHQLKWVILIKDELFTKSVQKLM